MKLDEQEFQRRLEQMTEREFRESVLRTLGKINKHMEPIMGAIATAIGELESTVTSLQTQLATANAQIAQLQAEVPDAADTAAVAGVAAFLNPPAPAPAP